MKKLLHLILLSVLVAAWLGSCSTTRRIPADDQLYTGVKAIKILSGADSFPSDLKDVLHEAVYVEPNTDALLFLPVGLWVYNNWSDSSRGLKRYLYEKLVQEPVLVSDVRPLLRTRMLDDILDNNGYFRGTTTYEVVTSSKNPKKASILYNVNPGRPFNIDSLILLPDTTALNHMIDSLARRDIYLSAVPDVRFSLDSLNTARTRIASRLRNRGYYYFRPEYIEYFADTLMRPGKVVMKMDIASNMPPFARLKYITGNVNVTVFRNLGGGEPDTFDLPKVRLIQMMPSRLRHSIFDSNVTFRKGRTFMERDVNNTQSYLARLGIFNALNINAMPDTSAAVPTVNVDIAATMDMPLEAGLEVNVASKSNSYLGPGLIFGVTNNNIFGGGEQLGVKVNANYEWQTGRGRSSLLNSYEFGISGTLSFPRMLAPSFIPRRRRQLNWTRINLNAEVLNRPNFFKMAQFNTGITYDWQSNRYVSNSFTPFKLTYTKLMKTTEQFDSMMVANPAVSLSFQSRFIPQISYAITFDKAYGRDNTLNFQGSVTEAGNVFWGIYELCGVKGEKKMFGTPFSQFIKGTAQLVWGTRVSGEKWLFTRVAVGAAHAYGNSQQVPYSEQFYCGGANSVRAFTVRSIGPGSYHDPAAKSTDYFDQTGTFKFEANLELRFPIAGPLHGAVFLDSGNVWLLRSDPLRPGGTLNGRTFFKELATGTGFGLRFDIGLLVLRGDLGIGIHAPYYTGRTGYYNMTSFGNSLAFHLAIGYPF